MIVFDDFLELVDVITEYQFNLIIESLPEIEDDNDFQYNTIIDFPGDVDEVAKGFINYILYDFDYAYVDDVNFENKTFCIHDVYSLEDLESIKDLFPKWTIENYDEEEEYIKSNEEEDIDNVESDEETQKLKLLSPVLKTMSLKEVEKLVNKLS
jgi:hypothetical protein